MPGALRAQEVEMVRVLIPLQAASLPGAGTSVWRTETTVYNATDTFVAHIPPGRCFATCGYQEYFSPRTFAYASEWRKFGSTLFVRVQREFAHQVWINVRAYDSTRMDASLGAAIPIVPETDFFLGSLQLLNVRSDHQVRGRLRVYALPDTPIPTEIVVRYYDLEGILAAEQSAVLSRRPPEQGEIQFPDYAEIAIPELGNRPMRIEVAALLQDAEIWAFATMTHNESHFVTIVAPHAAKQ
jgi:hypothetical protein